MSLLKQGVLSIITLAAHCGLAQEPPAETADPAVIDQAKTALDGLRNAYERLDTGRYSASGIYEVPSNNLIWELEFRGVFDLQNDRAHYFRREKREEDKSYIHLMTNDFRLCWMSTGAHSAGIHLPDDVENLSSTHSPRLVPWTMSMSQFGKLDYPFVKRLELLTSAASLERIRSVESVEGLLRIVWHRDSGYRSWILWVDPEMAYVPVRYQVGRARHEEPWNIIRVQDESETQWELLGDVAIPISWTAREYNIATAELETRYSLDFKWSDVNEPVDESVFTWQGAGLPEGTRVYDDRLGKTILIGRVGLDKPPEELFADDPKGPPYIQPGGGSRWTWYLTATATVLALACIFLFVAARRHNRKV